MRLIHTSDLHVSEGPRLADQAECLRRFLVEATALTPDLWMLTGDLFGRTVPHRSTPAERATLYPVIRKMAEIAPVVIVVGNHDDELDLDVLHNLGNGVHVFNRAGAHRIQLWNGGFGGPDLGGVAWVYVLPYPTKKWLLAGSDVRGVVDVQRAVEQRLAMLLTTWTASIADARAEDPDAAILFAGHVQIAGSKTSGGEVLAGQEIELTRWQLGELPVDYAALGHLHCSQEAANRAWYAGSLWRTDFGDHDLMKSWLCVDVQNKGAGFAPAPRTRNGEGLAASYAGDGRAPVIVTRFPSAARRMHTLEWRWAAPEGESEPRWVERPPLEADADAVDQVRDAEIRCRLVIPAQHVASCPWADELAALERCKPHRIIVERTIEPVYRMRAPAIASARTTRAKLEAYWTTLATPLTDDEKRATLDALADLESGDDAEIETRDGTLSPTLP